MDSPWGAYVAALARCDHRPGDRVTAECPGCGRPFAVTLPAAGAFVPVVAGGEVQVSCPFACGRTGVNALGRYLVADPAELGVRRDCQYCGVVTETAQPGLLCPLCAGY